MPSMLFHKVYILCIYVYVHIPYIFIKRHIVYF